MTRVDRVVHAPLSGTDAEPAAPSSTGSGSYVLSSHRDARIEHKIARAEKLLERLPANDSRRHLLHVAVLRRDEALIDGILSSLDEPAPPKSVR